MKTMIFMLLMYVAFGTFAQNPWIGETRWYSVIEEPGVTYTWTVPGDWNILSGQGSDSISVLVGSMSGYVTVTPSNACGDGPSQERFLEPQDSSATAVNDTESKRLKYYPNPVHDMLTIEMPADWNHVTPEFYDMKCSRIFLPFVRHGPLIEVDMSLLEAGVYSLKMTAAGRTFHYKLVKD